jgi:flagellar hook assembly protein FlgD
MHYTPNAIFGIFLLSFTSAFAQMGEGWKEYQPKKKIHLVDFENKEKAKGMSTFPWKPQAEVGKNSPASSYAYDTKTLTETFTLHDKRANRSEIRLQNEYGSGARQFEGYVTVFAPTDDQSIFQIWGSDEGATQLMLRAYKANGGELGLNNAVVRGTPRIAKGIFGKEVRVNVIHLQEDAGNKFIVYVDGVKKLEFADNEKVTNNKGKNYHKYGVYGTLKGKSAQAQWRKVRNFRDGTAPELEKK